MKSLLLDKVKNAVKQIEPSAEIILYGSRARRIFTKVQTGISLFLLTALLTLFGQTEYDMPFTMLN
jgi:hypothetical protein